MSGEYSREQIEKMQKDAERRVMEMQRRSKGAMEKEGASFGRQPSSGSPSEKPSDSRFSGGQNYGGRSSDPRPSSKNYDSCSLPGLSEKPRLLELLNINKLLNDPDDRLVLLLIALLSGEKADPLLLLSLLYIIL